MAVDPHGLPSVPSSKRAGCGLGCAGVVLLVACVAISPVWRERAFDFVYDDYGEDYGATFSDLGSLLHAGHGFREAHGRFPDAEEFERVCRPETSVVRDPWGRAYRVMTTERGTRFFVYTFGWDGRRGGEGRDKDLWWSMDVEGETDLGSGTLPGPEASAAPAGGA